MKQLHPSMRFGLFMLIVYFAISLTVILACNRNKDIDAKPNVPQQASVSSPYTTAATCNCAGSNFNCPQCVRDFLGGQTHKSYTINWRSCVSPGSIGCMGWTSTIDFCIVANSNCERVCCVIHDPPPCLPCLADGDLFEMGVFCSSTNTITLGALINGIDWELIANITGDPKISFTCRNTFTNDEYNCWGDVN